MVSNIDSLSRLKFVKQHEKLIQVLSLISKYITVLSIGFVVLNLGGSFIGPVLYFLFVIYLVESKIPSEFFINRVASAATLYVGLSPIYLIFRGFVTNSQLSSHDLFIYGTVFILLAHTFSRAKYRSESKYFWKERSLNKEFMNSLCALFLSVFVQELLKMKSVGHSIAWIASGDSKNHLVNGVDIISFGFLDPKTFYIQPSSSPSFLSLVLSNGSKIFESNINSLIYQMQIYSYVWIILIGILGCSFSAISQVVWHQFNSQGNRVPPLLTVVMSLIPTFSFVLGSALFDGFFTAIFGISAVVLLISWFLENTYRKGITYGKATLGLLLVLVSALSWSFLLPFTGLIYLVGLWTSFNGSFAAKKYLRASLILLPLVTLLSLHFSNFGQNLIFRTKVALNTDGASNVTNPNLFYVIVGTIILIGILMQKDFYAISRTLILVCATQILALVAFKFFSNLDILSWNYYLLKYQWVMFVSLAALLVSIVFAAVSKRLVDQKFKFVLALSLVFVITFTISETIVGTNRVWQKIWNGWDNPRAKTINSMLNHEIDNRNPTLFFHHGYAGESMMANFWLTAFANPIDPIKGWNYTIDTTGDPKQMCDVNAYYPLVTIVTSDNRLESELLNLCPEQKFVIKLEPPLY